MVMDSTFRSLTFFACLAENSPPGTVSLTPSLRTIVAFFCVSSQLFSPLGLMYVTSVTPRKVNEATQSSVNSQDGNTGENCS